MAAIGDAYSTAAEYRGVVGMTKTTEDAEILLDLKAVSRYIEGKLGRHFTQDAEAVARTYVPVASGATLRVDDLAATPTSIALDLNDDGTCETTLESTDYELLPLNAARGPEARPWTRIRLVGWGNYSHFPAGRRVVVTAQFGWPSVPEGVKRSCIQLTAILRLESPRATKRISELGEAVEASPDAMSIVRQLTDDYQVIHYA